MAEGKNIRSMKVAYVTTYDPTDIHAWSGTGFNVLQALRDTGLEVDAIGPLEDKFSFFSKLKFLYRKVLSIKYLRWLEPDVVANYSKQVKRRIDAKDYDVVFSLGTAPIAHLVTDKPIVFWSDATFAGLTGFYADFTGLIEETLRNGNAVEQLALTKCRLAIFSSEWAATSAVDNYEVDGRKVKVVPFGANMDCGRDLQAIQEITNNKATDCCTLLFIGVDWHRKGGARAIEIAQLLNQRGIKTELHIVGCNPPEDVPEFVKTHGFISKQTDQGKKFFEKMMSEAHFLIVPSVAECYGLVFAEASSFGLPSLTSRVGGTPTVVVNGKNGFTLELTATAQDYCQIIERLFNSRQEYENLAQSTFRQYKLRLNWATAGEKVRELLAIHCSAG